MFESHQRVDPAVEFPALAAAIAALPAPLPGGSAAAAAGRVRGLLMLRRQLDAALLAELSCFDSQGFGDAFGSPTTAAWLRTVGYLDEGQASRLVRTARTSTVLPMLTSELASGRIDIEHLHAVSRSTSSVPADELARHDETLWNQTIAARPSDLAASGRKITECWAHDVAQADRDRLRDIRRFDVAPTFEGLWHVDGLLPVEVGAALKTLLEPMAAKRGPEDERTPTQRRADALAELLDGALRHAPLPDVAGERPRLTLVIQATPLVLTGEDEGEPRLLVEDVLGRRGLSQAMIADGSLLAGWGPGSSANLIGARGELSPEALARLACDAVISTALVDRGGELMNLGRSSRFPSLAQRRALVVRDRGCVFPGCGRAPAGCIAHHLVFWTHGGRTDLDNLALVCHYHHHLVHDDRWVLERVAVSAEAPCGGWRATSPTGVELREFRQPAA